MQTMILLGVITVGIIVFKNAFFKSYKEMKKAIWDFPIED